MKKLLAILLCMVMAVSVLTACSSHVSYTTTTSTTENGVTTTTTTTKETNNGKTTESTVTTVDGEQLEEEIDPHHVTCFEASADGEIHRVDLTFANVSEGIGVEEIYIAPAGSSDWSTNLLPEGALNSGEYTDAPYINYNAENLLWDVHIVDSEGNKCTVSEIDFSDSPSDVIGIDLTYKGDGIWNAAWDSISRT